MDSAITSWRKPGRGRVLDQAGVGLRRRRRSSERAWRRPAARIWVDRSAALIWASSIVRAAVSRSWRSLSVCLSGGSGKASDPRLVPGGAAGRRGGRRGRSTVVVIVLTSGWKLTRVDGHQRRVEHDGDPPVRVVDDARRASPSPARRRASRAAARPSRRTAGPPRRSPRAAASGRCAVSSRATTRKSRPFLSLRNRFLVCPPGIAAAAPATPPR